MIKKLQKIHFLKDSFWTIGALCILNVTIQFLVYPFINRIMGAEEYGNILFLISIVNIIAVSVGVSTNNRRMVASAFEETKNGEYNAFLLVVSVLLLPLCTSLTYIFHVQMDVTEILLFWLLVCTTTWRYYADVEFRLRLNYKGYFAYYLFISIGYLVGMIGFNFVPQWTIILLPGEIFGLIYIAYKGQIFEKISIKREKMRIFLKAVLYLILAQLLVQIVFNADRFVLKIFGGGIAVTIYYLASLMGKTIALLTTPINSVIIGYLARSKEEMSAKRWIKIVGMCLLAGCGILIVCIIASHIVIGILYPDEYEMVVSLFWVANSAQIVYFITGVLTTILLRYVKEKYQLYINIAYTITFIILVIPATWKYELIGFAYAILAVNMFRLLYVFFLMLNMIRKQENLNKVTEV